MLSSAPGAARAVAILLVSVASTLAWGSAWEAAPDVKAVGGFDRPQKLTELDRSADVPVALLPDPAAPRALWAATDGIRGMPLDAAPRDAPTEARLLHETRGARALVAGAAAGAGWWAWVERDLRDGRYRIAWRWRGEERTAWEGAAASPEVVAVRRGTSPELVVNVRSEGRSRLTSVRWDGTTTHLYASELELAGVDALRHGDRLWVGWLEGRSDSALGRDRSEWSAWWVAFGAGGDAPRRLGEGTARARGDAVRLGVHRSEVHALWSAPGGALRWAAPEGTALNVGRGRPVGLMGDAWFWYDADTLWRAPAADPRRAEPVVRLPAAPTRMAGAAAGGARWFVWSSGRYEGGAEVWTVDDRRPYRPGWRDRIAARMGWDPWRFWASLAGQAATSLLLGVLLAAVSTPLLWSAAALMSPRLPARAGTVAWAGALLGAGALATLASVAVAVSPHGFARASVLLGGPLSVAAVLGAAVVAAWAARRRADAEPTLGVLSAAWLACGLGGALWLFLTFEAWQRALGGT